MKKLLLILCLIPSIAFSVPSNPVSGKEWKSGSHYNWNQDRKDVTSISPSKEATTADKTETLFAATTALIVIGVCFGAYFIPSLVALGRAHNNAGAISVLNLFLGWTFIGWVIALVWAMTDNVKKSAPRLTSPSTPHLLPVRQNYRE